MLSPYSLKHRPVWLLPYAANDGPYAGNTDCEYLSVGWAQYDPRSLSAKTLRHTGRKWSRQSEELPLHRVIDLALLIAGAYRRAGGSSITFEAGTFENQAKPVQLEPAFKNPREEATFVSLLRDDSVRNRLRALREFLNAMYESNEL